MAQNERGKSLNSSPGWASKRDMNRFSQVRSGRPATTGLRAMAAALLPLVASIILAGCASEPVDDRLVRKGEKPATKPSSCVPQGATRLPQKEECSSTPGRSHSKEDLDNAAGTTLEEKLRVLDPAISGPR
jgi:hypothetical protein